MNRKQLLTLLIVGLALGAAGLLVYRNQNATWHASTPTLGAKILPDFPINDVAHIHIEQTNAAVHLELADGKWRVKERSDYPASFSDIGDLLKKIWGLKAVQSVTVGPAQFGRLQLLPPAKGTNSGTLLSFSDKAGKPMAGLLLGKEYMRESPQSSAFGGGGFPSGRYLIATNRTDRVWLVSDAFTEVEAKPDRWLDKDFFKVTAPKFISVTSTNTTNSWTLTRETESSPWKLAETKRGETLDTNRVSVLNNVLSSPSFNDVASPDLPAAKSGFDHPRVARIETFDHFLYGLQIGDKTNDDNYYLRLTVEADFPKERPPVKDEKPDDKKKKDKEFQENLAKEQDRLKKEKSYEKWTYLVSKWTIDPLLKDRKDLLAEKKPEEKKPAAGIKTNAPALLRRTNAIPSKPTVTTTNRTTAVPPIPPMPPVAVRTNAPAKTNPPANPPAPAKTNQTSATATTRAVPK